MARERKLILRHASCIHFANQSKEVETVEVEMVEVETVETVGAEMKTCPPLCACLLLIL